MRTGTNFRENVDKGRAYGQIFPPPTRQPLRQCAATANFSAPHKIGADQHRKKGAGLIVRKFKMVTICVVSGKPDA